MCVRAIETHRARTGYVFVFFTVSATHVRAQAATAWTLTSSMQGLPPVREGAVLGIALDQGDYPVQIYFYLDGKVRDGTAFRAGAAAPLPMHNTRTIPHTHTHTIAAAFLIRTRTPLNSLSLSLCCRSCTRSRASAAR